ncbi:response regulator transcription factor [Poseidonocella sp. HB161398]|uniref:response regulator transcription factor n=1 Tax=Poseidonocella sp. HB161398 TaxID=2320855 RepID=UPI0011083AC9|nr:response regulator transcription factor [Poseidonocella sp. HB161398]
MTRSPVVEGEARLPRDLADFLQRCGVDSGSPDTVRGMLARDETVDMVILDADLPEGHGVDLAPGIIMRSALGDSDDRIRCVGSGADLSFAKNSTLRGIEAGGGRGRAGPVARARRR